ncbi:MAG TPA: response regulator [Flexivirga sp.]|uniref:response regulator n=1 Tax=Flexivirga sp. TaxID=1962927 RepID=UPI002C83D680|nr:response regulator [Flexivirga sp.]HWC24530.1 response regulator [Flexivirga sp.]
MMAGALRVLVVDDDFRVAGIHAAMVNRVAGFQVIGTAHGAEEALATARRTQPDLVLMDIYLPDGNGLEVVRALRNEPKPPDVMVISAARDTSSIREAMQLGAVHYLVKPFGFSALSERLTAYRRMWLHLAELPDHARQSDVDELFGMLRPTQSPATLLPKGHSAATLESVLKAIRDSDTDLSATEVAEAIGISRATAQRYLSYLEQHGMAKLQLRYGSAGRPEHRYRALRV